MDARESEGDSEDSSEGSRGNGGGDEEVSDVRKNYPLIQVFLNRTDTCIEGCLEVVRVCTLKLHVYFVLSSHQHSFGEDGEEMGDDADKRG